MRLWGAEEYHTPDSSDGCAVNQAHGEKGCWGRVVLCLIQDATWDLVKGECMANWDKILIAVDKTATAMNAVKYVGTLIDTLKPPHISLLYVYPEPPPNFYQTGGLLPDYEKEKKELANQIFDDSRVILKECGIEPENIDAVTRMASGETISQAILDVQQEGGFGTVVVGKRGVSKAEEFLFGSISNALVHSSGSFTVWVVG
jgi:nucleotide-binding universal stress UspA family protein